MIGTRSRAPAWQPHAQSSLVGGRPPAPLSAAVRQSTPAPTPCVRFVPVRLRACRPAADPAEADGEAEWGKEDLTVTPPPPFSWCPRRRGRGRRFRQRRGILVAPERPTVACPDMSGTSEAWQAQCHESDA